MTSFEPVRAILRGLEVLRAVSENGPLTASEVSKACRLPQPTAVRIIETLIEAGYVYRYPGQQVFGVTARTKSLSRGYDERSRLVQLAEPLIEDLRSRIGWPSNLAVLEGRSMIIVYSNRSANGMSIPGRLGAQIPLLATGVGTAYLAALDQAERERILDMLRKSQDRWDAEPSLWETLDERIEAAQRTGHAFAQEIYLNELYQSLIWAVGVPIKAFGEPVAAISSLVLNTAGSRDQQLSLVLPALEATAARIGRLLERDASAGMATGAGTAADATERA